MTLIIFYLYILLLFNDFIVISKYKLNKLKYEFLNTISFIKIYVGFIDLKTKSIKQGMKLSYI